MTTSSSEGVLLVVSGPAGVGKGTICDLVAKDNPDVFLSVSATSRPPRPGEQEGVHYYFKTREQFEQMIEDGALLEYNRYVNGNYYGTPSAPCDEQIARGASVILEIDVSGGEQVRKKRPDTVMVFVAPPDFCELERRLRGRGTETEEDIRGRLARAAQELHLARHYDYIIVNDTIEEAARKIKAVIEAEKCKRERCLEQVLGSAFKKEETI